MKIFVSWAKPQGRKLAEALKETILKIDGFDAFVSSEDIEFGSEWFAALTKKLKEADRALVCVTHDAIESTWVFFEMGALWARLNNVGVLVFGLDKDELQDNPLQQIQWARGNSKDDVARLLAEFVEPEDRERVKQCVEESWAAWTKRIQAITEPLAEAEVDKTVSTLGLAVIEALEAQRTRFKEFEFRLYSELASAELAKQGLPFDLALNGFLKVRSDRPMIRTSYEVSLLIRVVPDVLSFSHIEQVVLGAKTALGVGVKVTDNVRHDPWDTFVFLASTRFDVELAEESERPQGRKFVIGREQFMHTDYVNLFLLAEEGERRFFNTSPHEWMDPVLEAISFRWPQKGPASDRAI